MDEPMELFWEDLDIGEVHVRDKWQFSLKSEFFPKGVSPTGKYTQEFYFFIPNSLLINSSTYTAKEFYTDETNLIRYKTPEIPLSKIIDKQNKRSPLTRVMALCRQQDNPANRSQLSDELKLLANVVRSAIRREVKLLLFSLSAQPPPSPTTDFSERTLKLCTEISEFHKRYQEVQELYQRNWKDPLFFREMVYIDEFISKTISYYLCGLLENMRLIRQEAYADLDQALCTLLVKEKSLCEGLIKPGEEPLLSTRNSQETEDVLYRFSLLNKFVLNALLLSINRFSLEKRYEHWIGGISAGFAICIYFALYLWLGTVFLFNSLPFLMVMIFAYVLKDRLKEWLRAYSFLKVSKWFPDYTTIIKSPNLTRNIGVIKESFSFLSPQQLPKEVKDLRNVEYHTVLESFERPENIIFYKRIVEINAPSYSGARRMGLNVIFRFNIHRFLNKASDASETHLVIDPDTKKLLNVRLPKVYHVNLIIRTTTMEKGATGEAEFKKFRIIVDKNGIKRIEHVK